MQKIKRIAALVLCIALLAALCMPANASMTEDEQVLKLRSTMSLKQKIGQLLMLSFTDEALMEEVVKTCGIGGAVLFSDNLSGTAGTAELTWRLQNAATARDSLTGLPLLIAADQEGGTITRLKTGTMLCGNMALAATGDSALAEQAGSILGAELFAQGFQVDFAPVVDVNTNPANPVIGIRSFSDDPRTAASFGAAMVRGIQGQNVSATLKHFPGHGDTDTDSHVGLPRVDKTLEELRSCELIPFAEGIAAGVDMVMTAHIQLPQIEQKTYRSADTLEKVYLPATLSKTVITGILRQELGFRGVVCTDALNMDAIARHFDSMDAAKLALNAGVDILLMPVTISTRNDVNKLKAYIEGVSELVREGSVSEDTIDTAVARVLLLKIRRGIIDSRPGKQELVNRSLAQVGSQANHELERQITEKAVTLVKNQGMLPVTLTAGQTVAVFCSYNTEFNSFKYGVARLKEQGLIPADTDFRYYCYLGDDCEIYRDRLRAADVVIASVETDKPADMDATVSSGWQAAFLDDLIDMTHGMGKQIAVLSIQLPYDLTRYQKADALLAAYNAKGMKVYPSSFKGETTTFGPNIPAAICAVFGGFVPSGTLPVNVPDSRGNVVYARGFGLQNWGSTSVFRDVPRDRYFAPAVDWAFAQGIVMGTAPQTFSPDAPMLRRDMVTLLYRAAGMPEPKAAHSFTDVVPGSYYEKAVSWACEAGIVAGDGSGHFMPNKQCTRAQCVTMLARYDGVKTFAGGTDYTDVPETAYYAGPVHWATGRGIINGVGNGRFSPDTACTRAQAVTLLWRYEN